MCCISLSPSTNKLYSSLQEFLKCAQKKCHSCMQVCVCLKSNYHFENSCRGISRILWKQRKIYKDRERALQCQMTSPLFRSSDKSCLHDSVAAHTFLLSRRFTTNECAICVLLKRYLLQMPCDAEMIM